MEEGDNDNEVKLIQSGGGGLEHNVQMSKLICSHAILHTPQCRDTRTGVRVHARTHTNTMTMFFRHSVEDVAIKSTFRCIIKT